MTRMTIFRTDQNLPDPRAMDGARALLFDAVDGFTRDDKRAWRRLWKRITGMEPGEMLSVETVFPRSGPFHRRHMKIEQAVFDAQERFENFGMLRYWLKVGAGWVKWAAGPKGGVVPIPKSISYAKADEEEFRCYHEQVIGFLRGPHAAKYLWPHLPQPMEMMWAILEGFGE